MKTYFNVREKESLCDGENEREKGRGREGAIK